ncbi:MAG: cystathionine beta-synthase [Chloroflexales bacterium]|nr:cystathionine beta-synthase [Chloroflexales bacterium]
MIDTATPATISTTASIHDNILETIGNTPLVQLHKITRGIRATVAAKVEFLNPGGSVKDRIGITMIEDAERRELLKPGGTIVEPTSGNTGMGLAIAAAIKGYKTIFVMPDKMSEEKIRALRAFGARVVITPTAVEPDDPRSYYSVSRRLAEETPNAFLAGQYWNPANPEAHYRTTGPEIWQQTGGRVAAFVAGMGTGGTISGTGRFLKERNPNIKIVGVDPIGSLLHHYFHTGELQPAYSYKVEGVGEDFLPGTLDFGVIDDVVQVSDRESFLTTRRLVREEGIFCGGSCGLAAAGAIKWLRGPGSELSEEDVVVVLLPDNGSRYLSKIFDDAWMRENGFLEEATVADMLASRSREVISAQEHTNIETAIRMMKQHSISQLPVLNAQGNLHGLISESDLLDYLVNGGAMDHSIADLHVHAVATISADTSVEELATLFGHNAAAVVLEDNKVTGIVTKIDVIDFLANRER